MQTETQDASFFEEVHKLFQAADEDSERRGRARRAFLRVQLIAPLADGQLPPESEFRDVNCHDLSARGFSYLTLRPPECSHLIVGLGTYPTMFYLKAEVRHYSQVWENNQPMYLVGCMFTGRMET